MILDISIYLYIFEYIRSSDYASRSPNANILRYWGSSDHPLRLGCREQRYPAERMSGTLARSVSYGRFVRGYHQQNMDWYGTIASNLRILKFPSPGHIEIKSPETDFRSRLSRPSPLWVWRSRSPQCPAPRCIMDLDLPASLSCENHERRGLKRQQILYMIFMEVQIPKSWGYPPRVFFIQFCLGGSMK